MLRRKGVKVGWSKECRMTFKKLRVVFVTAPFLAHFNWISEVVVGIDVSDWVSAGVLSQCGDIELLYSVIFY